MNKKQQVDDLSMPRSSLEENASVLYPPSFPYSHIASDLLLIPTSIGGFASDVYGMAFGVAVDPCLRADFRVLRTGVVDGPELLR